MGKIYLPEYNIDNCAYIQSEGVIRVYETKPTSPGNYNYIEYFYDSNYYTRSGVQSFSNYSTYPSCILSDDITTNIYYRNDLMEILVCFFIILLVCFYFPFRIASRMFGRWLKW